ncbi:MAG: 50S ribosomal protein L29 [Candidatus Uhrbacteria bacterium]|nr:50S ribosomal protein L29 [Candidatus Uhrbacteria bacterium]
MKISELREKTEHELTTLLQEAREGIRANRFKVATKQLKNVREIRVQRQLVARILTLMRVKKQS